MKRRAAAATITRRAAIAATMAAPLVALAACRQEEPLPEGVSVPLASLPEGRRVRVLRGEEPVELLREGDEVRALSLWCTHLGCEVAWSASRGRYLCPCHEGEYDAAGHAVAGPPPRDLVAIALVRGRDRVVLPPGNVARPAPPAEGRIRRSS